MLAENACRAAAVREWTATDGTTTRLELLHFGSATEAAVVSARLWNNGAPKGVELRTDTVTGLPSAAGVSVALRSNRGSGPDGPASIATSRVGYLLAGDVVGVVVMSNPANVPVQAFRQVVVLQSEMLV